MCCHIVYIVNTVYVLLYCFIVILLYCTMVHILFVFRYASDHAFDGYKSLCQHKMLDSEKFGDKFSRVYLPSILELVAIQERKRMALLAIFSDGTTNRCLLSQ